MCDIYIYICKVCLKYADILLFSQNLKKSQKTMIVVAKRLFTFYLSDNGTKIVRRI